MLKLAFDESLDNRILHGLLLRLPDLDVKRVQDEGLAAASDQAILEWAANANRIVVSPDKRTMTVFAYKRVEAGLSMPGVFAIRRNSSIGKVIEDLVFILETSDDNEWNNLVEYIPL